LSPPSTVFDLYFPPRRPAFALLPSQTLRRAVYFLKKTLSQPSILADR
jgi:hypothetical protein